MPIPNPLLSTVTEADLRALIAGGVREDRTLDFKRDAYGGNDDARGEFLADVSALANTLGGDLVIGVGEDAGIATALPGLGPGMDIDQEILRLSQMAQTGLQPRLVGLEMHAVPLAAGGHALVVRVRRSYQRPHRIVFKNRNRFWARSPAGRYEPDVDELRAIFTAAPTLAQRIREIRADRVAAVLAGEAALALSDDPGLFILHVVPFETAENAAAHVDIANLEAELTALNPPAARGLSFDLNLDGFVVHDAGRSDDRCSAYTQVFRNGLVEAARSGLMHPAPSGPVPVISVEEVARFLISYVVRTVPLLRRRGVTSPCAVLLTLAGVKGARLASTGPNAFVHLLHPPRPLQRDVLSFIDQIVPETARGDLDIRRSIKSLLDQVFQGAGIKEAPSAWTEEK